MITEATINLDLSKGSVIPVETVQELVHREYGTKEYDMALIQLVQAIDKDLERDGCVYTLCTVKGAIHILDDEEAVSYNMRRNNQHIRGIARSLHKQRGVDKTRLAPEVKRAHERNVDLQSRILQAIYRTRREFKAEEHKRKTPGLD